MSDVIEIIEKNIETLEMLEKEYEKRATPRMKFASIRSALNNAVISLKKTRDRYSEELAKEPHECNSDLISRTKLIRDLFYSPDGNRYRTRDCDNFPITISLEDLRKVLNNQPQVQPIVRSTEETKQKLMEYFNIGDSSAYYLTRVKEAFSIGTMTLDDFVEFTENDIDDLVDYLTKKEV